MASGVYDLEDSDSEYDPSKIPPAKRPKPPDKPSPGYPCAAAQEAATPPVPTPTAHLQHLPSHMQHHPQHPPQHLPMAIAHPPMHPHMTPHQHAEAAREAIFMEAERDWQEVDRVFTRPMFAPTEDLENAFALLRKWSEEAELKYGSDVRQHLRGRGIALPNVTERRKQELQRILGLRRQSAIEKGVDQGPPPPPPQIQTPTQAHTPPSEPRSTHSVPPPIQQPTDRPTIRPPLYQAPDLPRSESRNNAPEHPPPPPPPLPPMYSEPPRASRPTSHPPPPPIHYPHYPPHGHHAPPPAPPEHVIPSIHTPQSEFYCRYCHRGPLSCMHSHRMIERMVANGLRHRSSEELSFAEERVYEWLYRGRPIEIEPHVQSKMPRQELADTHFRWLQDIRHTLNQRYGPPPAARSMTPPNVTPDMRSPMLSNPGARSVSVPSGHDQYTPSASVHSDRAPTSQHSTPMIPQKGLSPERRRHLEPTSPRRSSFVVPPGDYHRPLPRSDVSADPYNREMHSREASQIPQYSIYGHRQSASQDSVLLRKQPKPEMGRCTICNTHSTSCVHQHGKEEARAQARPAGSSQQATRDAFLQSEGRDQFSERSSRKRKRHSISEQRRHRVGFRRENGYRDSGVVLSSDDDFGDDDDEVVERPSKLRSISSSKSTELVASLLEKASKERLVKSILKLCESNHLVLSWLKKDLQKPEPPKDLAITNETSLITPVSPRRTRSGRIEPTSAPEAGETLTCTRCDAEYDGASEREQNECRYHDGDLVQKLQGGEQVTTITDRAWYLEHHAATCMWTCCGERGRTAGCKFGKHTITPTQQSNDTSAPQLSSISDMISPLTSKTAPGPKRPEDDTATFLGQDFVRRICEAEKEQEKSEKLKEQRSPKSPPPPRPPGSGPLPSDTDFQSLPDYCPPLNTLPNDDPETIFKVEKLFSVHIDLSTDPDRHRLHKAEIILAQKLRFTCASYLCTKRRIFMGLVENLREGRDYKKSYAQNACKVDARKTRCLFSAFEAVGWFEPKYFTKWAPNAKLGTGEMSDSELSSLDEQAISGAPAENSATRRKSSAHSYQPAAASHTIPISHSATTPNSDSTSTLTNGDRPASSGGSRRKQPNPTHLLHATTSFKPVNDVSHPAPLPPLSPHPRTPLAPAPPNGIGPAYSSNYSSGPPSSHGSSNPYKLENPHTPTRDSFSSDSPETFQWRKTASGKKQQVPICPYPRSWAEADSVDRELVQLKRHEGKQWEELFEWWRGKGRQSLKNASCLAVRYSILKKNFEDVWAAEGV